MRTAIGLISLSLGAHALVPASAAPVAPKATALVAPKSTAAVSKCSFKMKELSGDLLVLQDDGRYCEATNVERAAKEQSLATYYKELFPEEPNFAAFASQAGLTKTGGSTKGRGASIPAGGADAALVKATYDYCVRQNRGISFCREAAPNVAEYAKGQMYAKCAADGLDRDTCDAAITLGAQQLYSR
jgi:hypothetical protein